MFHRLFNWSCMAQEYYVCFCEKLIGFAGGLSHYVLGGKIVLALSLVGVFSHALIQSGPIHNATRTGDVAQVKRLLSGGLFEGKTPQADINEKDEAGLTPLYVAAREGHEAVVRLLIKSGANKEAQDKDGWTPLYFAAVKGHEAVARLLIESGANIEAQSKDGWTLLHWVAQQGHEAVVRLLIEGGANKEAQGKDGRTPLHWAVVKGHEAVVRLLIESGANKEAQDNYRWTPLHAATYNGHEAVARLLIESGANKEAQDNYGWTPLHAAAMEGHEAVVELLLDRGANPTTQTTKQHEDEGVTIPAGSTPLHIAVLNDKDVVVRLFLERGANPELQTNDGWTPLHFAAREGKDTVARLLLDRGADPTVRITQPLKWENITIPAGSIPGDLARLTGYHGLAQSLSAAVTSYQPPAHDQKPQGHSLFDASHGASSAVAGSGDAGKPSITPSVLPEPRDPITLALRDHGITIAPDDLKKLPNIDIESLRASALFVTQWQQELHSVAQKEHRFAITNREQEALLVHRNINVGDYYEVLWSKLSDTLLACKTMHSGQVANGFENNFDTAAMVIVTNAAGNIPVVGPFVGLLSGILEFVKEGQKKRVVTQLATLMHTVEEIDLVTEEVARCLTHNRMSQLLTMQQNASSSLSVRFKTEWQHFRGEEYTTEAKRLAAQDADKIIKAIVADTDGQLRGSDLVEKLIRCVNPDYRPVALAPVQRTSPLPVSALDTLVLHGSTVLRAMVPHTTVPGTPVSQSHGGGPAGAHVTTPADVNTVAVLQTENQQLKRELQQLRKEQEQLREKLATFEGRAAGADEVRTIKRNLQELSKKIGDKEKIAEGGPQVLADRGQGQHGPAQDDLALRREVVQQGQRLGHVETILAGLGEHSELRDSFRIPEDTMPVPQSDFIDEITNALAKDNVDRLQWFLDRGARLDMCTPDNNTVVHLAIHHGAHACLSHILEQTPLVIVTNLLMKPNGDGKTPFQLADALEDYEAGVMLQPFKALIKGKGRE